MTRAELVERMARAMLELPKPEDASEVLDLATAALEAIEAAGLAVVPREPTDSMLDAAIRAWTPGMNHAGAHESRYRAMLAASPFAKDTPGE